MKLWDADTPDEKVETDAGVESCENPKSRFEINRDIPSETERNQSNFSASGTALKIKQCPTLRVRPHKNIIG